MALGYGQTAAYGLLDYKGESGVVVPVEVGAVNRINFETGVCLRLAIKPDQGIGWSEYKNGTAWIWSEPLSTPLIIIDDNDQPRPIILDETTGRWFELTSRDGPAKSGIVRAFLDKDSAYAGTEIPTELKLKEHSGSEEHMFLEHVESHVYFRPDKEENKGAAGFGAAGFRKAFEVDIQMFKDGAVTTPIKTRDIPLNGDIAFDRKVEGKRLQPKINTTASQYRMVGTNQYYDMKDSAESRTNRQMTEQDFQEEFATPALWLTRGPNLTLDRAVAVQMTGSIFSSTEGPDGDSESAMAFSPADGLSRTIKDLDGAMTFLFWVSDIDVNTDIIEFSTGGLKITVEKDSIGDFFLVFDDGDNVLRQQLNWDGAGYVALMIVLSGDDARFYEDGDLRNTFVLSAFNTYGGIVSIMDAASGSLFDGRIFDYAITGAAFDYYHDNVVNNNGNSVLPT